MASKITKRETVAFFWLVDWFVSLARIVTTSDTPDDRLARPGKPLHA
jgi:hypothetical protein